MHTAIDETEQIMPQCKEIDLVNIKYPFCVVWTPIPILTWLFPVIGHMGIGTSSGIIRDFAGPYQVSEDNMAFGDPVKYWQMNSDLVPGGAPAWDKGIAEAAEVYKKRVHNLCFDNCHSMVALALNNMQYKNRTSYNMVILAFLMLIHGNYISLYACVKTWGPFIVILGVTLFLLYIPF